MYHARAFMDDLASRLKYRIQLSSDALDSYAGAVERGFGCDVDYGQIVKTYSVPEACKDAARRYSPSEIVEVEKTVLQGRPDITLICTSHVEKQNHTLRLAYPQRQAQFLLTSEVDPSQDYVCRLDNCSIDDDVTSAK